MIKTGLNRIRHIELLCEFRSGTEKHCQLTNSAYGHLATLKATSCTKKDELNAVKFGDICTHTHRKYPIYVSLKYTVSGTR